MLEDWCYSKALFKIRFAEFSMHHLNKNTDDKCLRRQLGTVSNVKMHSIYCNIITNVLAKFRHSFDKNK